MVTLVLAVLLSMAVPAAAQNTLQLPDVVLFGEYTLYLAAPEPKPLEVPVATGLADRRFVYARSLFKVNLALPVAPVLYWQNIPRSQLAPPGLLPDILPDGAQADSRSAQTIPGSSWQGGIDYIPGNMISAALSVATQTSGAWDLSADLGIDLADGWVPRVSSPPDSPADMLFFVQAQARRRAEALNIETAIGAGAFYNTGASTLYTLNAAAGLHGRTGILRWREETRGVGISGLGSGPDTGRGAVQQDIELALVGARLELLLRASGVLAAGFPTVVEQKHGCLAAELGWRNRESILRMWAGAAALYYEDSLIFYPSGGLQLYPTESLSLLLRAAPFVRLPAEWKLHAVWTDAGLAQLESEGGYSLLGELRFDPFAALGAALSFEWRKGSFYYLDASAPAADPELSFADSNQGILEGNLHWQIRPGRPGIRLNLTGELAFPFPVSEMPWQDLLYKNAGLVWTTDFHKLPVEFIIRALIGEYADNGSQSFLFADWEIVSGLTTGIEGNWKIGKHGIMHTGFEAFFTPAFSFRFLIGYGIHR